MTNMRLKISLTGWLAYFFLFIIVANYVIAQTQNNLTKSLISPRPRFQTSSEKFLELTDNRNEITVFVSTRANRLSNPLNEGLELLSKRLERIGNAKMQVSEKSSHRIFIDQCTDKKMQSILRDAGVKEQLDGKRLLQAYYLLVQQSGQGKPVVTVRASGEPGLYYGLVSLCQLINSDERGKVSIQETKIADWPETGLRLAKTSASNNSLTLINNFIHWMPLYKINMAGLQFHGEESKEPGVFKDNIKSVCSQQKKQGLLETIVYFCPFKGNGYDFFKSSDRDEYLKFIDWVFKQGAHGFEIDYNDWPDKNKAMPIEDVINMVYEAVNNIKPDAYLLYCPPNKGPAQYRGKATPEMTRVLSKIPSRVWPLWTGMTTIVTDTLKPEQVEQWTEEAGRRPFFWINRASVGVEKSFSRPLENFSDALIIPGELLPKELNRLFEGIHLNYVFSAGPRHTLPAEVSAEELAYFATVADYIWNPYDWDAKGSYQRAKHFVKIMKPLITD